MSYFIFFASFFTSWYLLYKVTSHAWHNIIEMIDEEEDRQSAYAGLIVLSLLMAAIFSIIVVAIFNTIVKANQ